MSSAAQLTARVCELGGRIARELGPPATVPVEGGEWGAKTFSAEIDARVFASVGWASWVVI